MAIRTKTPQQEALGRVLARHREELPRLREQLGDPKEAFDQFVRETYSYEDLLEMYRFLIEGEDDEDCNDLNDAR